MGLCKTIFVIIVFCVLAQTGYSREKVTLWFWGAPPNLQEAFQKNMIEPFRAAQNKYELEIEFLLQCKQFFL